MDASTILDLHQAWDANKDHLQKRQESELALQEKLLENEEHDLRTINDRQLKELKKDVPTSKYRDLILPMAEKSLKHDLQQVRDAHSRRIKVLEKRHSEETEELNKSYQTKLDDAQQNADNSTDTQEINASHFQDSKKRKPSTPDEPSLKRLRVDTSVNPLHTPATTPCNESIHLPQRTVTFDQVYRGGNSKFKDTIIEYPSDSNQWYILKCDKHGLRFWRSPVAGAAKHLNGLNHGFPDRNRDTAIKTLGYLVVGCNKDLAELNNRVSEEAYNNGYRPPLPRSTAVRTAKKPATQLTEARELPRSSRSSVADVTLGAVQERATTPKTLTTEEDKELEPPSSHLKSPKPWNGIAYPKTFFIYYCRWKANSQRQDEGEIYPVMILGWDSQTGSGLKDTDLAKTGLLKKSSHPPACYHYGTRKIIGWAPGFEDGGQKVRLRKFPVMFFDESQTVAWVPARDLTKFPLYKKVTPTRSDHPIHAARRWIAEREHCETWEERERKRMEGSTATIPSVSPLTPAGESGDLISHDGHPAVDNNAAHSSSQESETMSDVTADTEKMMEDLREKAGEIPGDDDYSASGSENDDSHDSGVEEWDQPSHTADPDHTPSRPWAFYGLRSTDDAGEPKSLIRSPDRTQGNSSKPSIIADSRDPPSAAGKKTHATEVRHAASVPPPSAATPLHLEDRAASVPRGKTSGERQPMPTGLATVSASRDTKPTLETQGNRTLHSDTQPSLETAESPSTDNATSGSTEKVVREGDLDGRIGNRTLEGLDKVVEEFESVANVDSQPVHMNEDTIMEDVQSDVHSKQLEAGQIDDAQSSGAHNPSTKDDAIPEADAPISTQEPLNLESSTRVVEADGKNENTKLPPDGPAEFELFIYSRGDTSWRRQDEQENCIKLFYYVGREKTSTWEAPVEAWIDPKEISSFSRDGENVLVLKHKDGSSSRLGFDRSKESELNVGKIQARKFIKWLRGVNQDIRCVEL
ncbi:hypothetical protein M426DRAFT_325171 [Hypoxylon sp. CI-4A]|nr:hypothetical protein M426DRAFT_325171 [Hypoxylon sp. CI-4A]